jgi:hypothetical protein
MLPIPRYQREIGIERSCGDQGIKGPETVTIAIQASGKESTKFAARALLRDMSTITSVSIRYAIRTYPRGATLWGCPEACRRS